MLWLNFCNFPRKSGVLDCLAFFSMVFPSFFQPFRGLGGRRFRRFRGDSEHRQRLRRAFGARALATVLHLDEGRGTAKAHGQQQRQLCVFTLCGRDPERNDMAKGEKNGFKITVARISLRKPWSRI